MEIEVNNGLELRSEDDLRFELPVEERGSVHCC